VTTDFHAEARLDAAERGPVHVRAVASEAERRAAARRLGLDRVEALTLDARLERTASGDVYLAAGEATLVAERTCVVTLDPFMETTTASFEELFTTSPEKASDPDGPPSLDAPEIELVDEERIDLGEIALQYLAMELDPYPRSPEAEAAAPADADLAADAAAGKRRPFAGLDRLLAERGKRS